MNNKITLNYAYSAFCMWYYRSGLLPSSLKPQIHCQSSSRPICLDLLLTTPSSCDKREQKLQMQTCSAISTNKRSGSVSHSAFLLVIRARKCSIEDEVSLHHTDSQEGRHGFGRCEILSTDLKPLSIVKTVGATCLPTAFGVS